MDNGIGGIVESDTFDIVGAADNRRPKISYMSHRNQLLFADQNEAVFYFSEPVDTTISTDSLMFITDDNEYTLPFTVDWVNAAFLKTTIDDLEPGMQYHIDFNREIVRDLSGNKIGDSLWRFNFRTYDTDSLGKVSGTVQIGSGVDSTGNIRIAFTPIRGKNKFEKGIVGSDFEQTLPPGKYFLHAYIDRNGNDREDRGSLFPFEYSESRALYPDTIRVRARFETAGIDLKFE
jgi:hypothetical protein